MNSKLRDAVLHEIHKSWERVAAQPDNDKVMGAPPDDLTTFESTTANFAQADCTGEFSAIETWNRGGGVQSPRFSHPRELAASIRGAYWKHAQARFYISESQRMAVLELVFGPRYGRGYRFTLVADGSVTHSNIWVS